MTFAQASVLGKYGIYDVYTILFFKFTSDNRLSNSPDRQMNNFIHKNTLLVNLLNIYAYYE